MGSLHTYKDSYHKSKHETARFKDLEELAISHITVRCVKWCAPSLKTNW